LIDDVTENAISVIERAGQELPDHFPVDLAEVVFKGMSQQAAKLAKAT
jgi:hypothetical protein